VEDCREREVTFKASDGWRIGGSLHVPQSKRQVPSVLFVHGSRHESDAYGNLTAPGIPQTLIRRGIATLRIDIRGRGASREPRDFYLMAPDEMARVGLDVEAAIKFLGSERGVDASRIGIVAEQDSATAAVLASSKNRRVRAFILISGRLSHSAKVAMRRTSAPMLCLVSKEDRRGFRDMIDAFLSSKSDLSRIRVFEGLALGTTMFSTWRNEFPNEQPIDELAGIWLAQMLTGSGRTATARRKRAQ
jgi:pimeloyl-ACP methyl ester carboxylesterase